MIVVACKLLASGIACLGVIGSGIRIGVIFGSYLLALYRGFNLKSELFSTMLLRFALVETTGLFSLLFAFLLLFVKKTIRIKKGLKRVFYKLPTILIKAKRWRAEAPFKHWWYFGRKPKYPQRRLQSSYGSKFTPCCYLCVDRCSRVSRWPLFL